MIHNGPRIAITLPIANIARKGFADIIIGGSLGRWRILPLAKFIHTPPIYSRHTPGPIYIQKDTLSPAFPCKATPVIPGIFDHPVTRRSGKAANLRGARRASSVGPAVLFESRFSSSSAIRRTRYTRGPFWSRQFKTAYYFATDWHTYSKARLTIATNRLGC